MTVRPAARLVGALAVALVASATLVLGAPAAQAHDTLQGTDPSDGATVAVAPDHVTLQFSETVQALGTEIQVRYSNGPLVSSGEASVSGSLVTQRLVDARPAGTYTVQWRVTSDDGHPVSGSFTFTAERATGVAPKTATKGAATATTQAAPTQAVPTQTATHEAPAAEAEKPGAWGTGDNRVRPALVGFLLLLGAVGVGTATWLVARRR